MRFKSSGELLIFILKRFFNFLARVANLSVETVSSMLAECDEQVTIKAVL